MNRAAIVVSLLAALLAGAALGLIGGILFSHHMHARMAPVAPGPAPGFGPGSPGRMGMPMHDPLRRLRRLLDLSPEQLRRIEPYVQQTQRQVEAARDSLHRHIESELTADQRERWREFQRSHPFPGPFRGAHDRARRAPPGDEGDPR